MPTKVHMAIYDTLADWEVGHATAHINDGTWQREPGRYEIVTVGASRTPVTSKGGLTITPDITLDELEPSDSAMLILPGADTWMAGGNTGFAKKAQAFVGADVPVAAICGATVGLAAAGLLDDRDHTSNAPIVLASTGYHGAAHYKDTPSVKDGNLVTASGTAPVAFARDVLDVLGVYEPQVLASWYKLYGEGDPAGYFELEAGTS